MAVPGASFCYGASTSTFVALGTTFAPGALVRFCTVMLVSLASGFPPTSTVNAAGDRFSQLLQGFRRPVGRSYRHIDTSIDIPISSPRAGAQDRARCGPSAAAAQRRTDPANRFTKATRSTKVYVVTLVTI